MISRKYETIVGLFVVGGLAAMFFMVLVIAQHEGLWQDRVAYYAIFKNISGLKKGSEVRLSGVTVGSVTQVTIAAQGNIMVTFEVLSKYQDQIRQDSRASIGFIGLLGDRSLDLTAGSPEAPVIPPRGLVMTVEPLDLTEMLGKATPYLERLQKLLDNLAALSEDFRDPQGNINRLFAQLSQMVEKTNQGQGTLGLLVNDPALYREAVQATAAINKFSGRLINNQGLLNTLINDATFQAEAKKALEDLKTMLNRLERSTRPLEESLSKLPGLMDKTEVFLDNLRRASATLPGLVEEGQSLLGDANKVAQAAQKTWLLRRHLPQPQERTIRIEKDVR